MHFERMANTISSSINYMCYESECKDKVKEIQAAEKVMYELVNLLKEEDITTVSKLKDVFKDIHRIIELAEIMEEQLEDVL